MGYVVNCTFKSAMALGAGWSVSKIHQFLRANLCDKDEGSATHELQAFC